ncbi:MAG: F-type H+-transporting ATPase subunit a [Candidatus Omnitrophota bacterium]|jgi:F-type H+-transporting ATPase subunit a
MANTKNPQDFKLDEYIMDHVLNSTEWHLPFLPTIHLPHLTLHGAMLIIASFILIITFCFLYKKEQVVPKGLTNCLEAFIIFIRDDIVAPCMGEKDVRKMTPLFCTFFFFILTLNIMGLIPIFSTATANVNVTAGLASITLGFMIFGTIYKNGFKGFMQAITPSGVPLPVLFILVPIEFIGLIIKSFSLTIRLFANLLAGHIVIFALLGLAVIVGMGAVVPAVLLALFIYLLEIMVAFLQAYVFTLLSAMFIGQMYNPHH